MNKLHFNADISWLLNESRGELGEQGMAISGEPGGSKITDTWHLHERMHRAGWAVRKWRRLQSIFDQLDPKHQLTLRSRYRDEERQHSEVRGLKAAFGDLAGLAWSICGDRVAMRHELSLFKPSTRNPVINRLLKLAEEQNREAHEAWLQEEGIQALTAPCPPWSRAHAE